MQACVVHVSPCDIVQEMEWISVYCTVEHRAWPWAGLQVGARLQLCQLTAEPSSSGYALYRADMYHFCSEIVLVLVVHILFLTVACDKVMAFGHELEILVKLQAWKGCTTHVRGLAQGPYGCVAERSFASFLMIDAV